MANEFKHASAGTELTQAEFEATTLHVCNSQAAGDILYASSATQISRLGKGTDGDSLTLASGVPAWNTAVQNNVTASRVLGTVYQNTSGRLLYVLVSLTTTGNAGDSAIGTAYTDTNAAPSTIVGRCCVDFDTDVDTNCIGFFVLPSSYYKVIEGGDGALYKWFEWEM